ncbi:MAG: sigma-70 family RNA polymerase sigma factor [Chitinophagaceae bacterium]|nr:sigma-70 family RNA polymerase sigma factor [Chitinophagaceae bacterium]
MADNIKDWIGDERLLRSLAKGDSPAIKQIYKECFPTVLKMMIAYNKTEEDAYDIFQEAMTILYKKSKDEQFSLTCKLSTFLVAISKNLLFKKFEKEKKERQSLTQSESEIIQSHDVEIEHFLALEENVKKLRLAVASLGQPCAGIITSFYIDNKSMQEIAEEYNYSNTDTAKNQKYKCLNRLKKLFLNKL